MMSERRERPNVQKVDRFLTRADKDKLMTNPSPMVSVRGMTGRVEMCVRRSSVSQTLTQLPMHQKFQ